jgi:hypothetical protein
MGVDGVAGVTRVLEVILEELVQSRPPNLGTADAMIHIFLKDVVAALPCELAQFNTLRLRVLVERRNAEVQRRTLHRATSI